MHNKSVDWQLLIKRIHLLKMAYLIVLIAIVMRLFYWQVIRYDDLVARAESQHLINYSISAPRGNIYAAKGELLAGNRPTFLLYGLPKIIEDKEGLAMKLATVITDYRQKKALEDNPALAAVKVSLKEKEAERLKGIMDLRERFVKDFNQDLFWVPLQREVDIALKQEIEKLSHKGIGFENRVARYYPESSSSAHILGFTGADSVGETVGYFGLEGFYNRILKGVSGTVTEEKDALGLPILMGKFFKKEPKLGDDLILNIDLPIQLMVEKKLKQGVEKYGAKSGSAVVMDPKTGAVLAMASYPNYDPNLFGNFPDENYKNPIVADSYEPGSTFKVLVMAAAINEKLVSPQTRCDICSGPLKISGFTIRTWNNQYRDNATMTDVIIHSDNTGMVFISKKLGIDKMYQYITDYGFGEMTRVDLQDETSPDIRPKEEWKEIDLATSSFGQGIAVTPIQIVRAVSVIANGGNLMEPQVVKAIKSGNKITPIKPKVVKKVLSDEATRLVTQMMVEAVVQGEAKFAAPKGYKIAGKTGTAQIPVAGHYDPNKTIASFVGFAPAADPRFVMLVRYQEPTSSIYGAETAAPTFFQIAKEILTYYGIPPTN